jgi:hypothetical protein
MLCMFKFNDKVINFPAKYWTCFLLNCRQAQACIVPRRTIASWQQMFLCTLETWSQCFLPRLLSVPKGKFPRIISLTHGLVTNLPWHVNIVIMLFDLDTWRTIDEVPENCR